MADESGLSRNRRYIVWDTEKASLNKLQTCEISGCHGGEDDDDDDDNDDDDDVLGFGAV
jgi:hypothetical protein